MMDSLPIVKTTSPGSIFQNSAAPTVSPPHQGLDLPLNLWLRGDEDFFTEFNVDATAAMNILGIKRTRLTQISGRELRVGRVKSGRYIKPMYRPKDLEAYLQHSRAPMTHHKAALISEKVDASVKEWEQIIGNSFHSFDERLTQLTQEQKKITNIFAKEQLQTLSELVNKQFALLKQNYREEIGGLQSKILLLNQVVSNFEASLEAIKEQNKLLLTLFEQLHLDQRELHSLAKTSSIGQDEIIRTLGSIGTQIPTKPIVRYDQSKTPILPLSTKLRPIEIQPKASHKKTYKYKTAQVKGVLKVKGLGLA